MAYCTVVGDPVSPAMIMSTVSPDVFLLSFLANVDAFLHVDVQVELCKPEFNPAASVIAMWE